MQSSAAQSQAFESLANLLNFEKKREVEKYCRALEVRSGAFTNLILCGRTGALHPYQYACRFRHDMPSHLNPTQAEIHAAGRVKVGPLRGQGAASKFFRKIFQSYEERRLFAAHLFYSPCQRWWHLFYFDQRDRSEYRNHWRHGPHIHYTSDMFTHHPLPTAWEHVCDGHTNLLKGLHLRYIDDAADLRGKRVTAA